MIEAPTSERNHIAVAELNATAASFARHLRAENKAPSTVVTYGKAVAQLTQFLVTTGMPTTVAAIRREHVEAFLIALQERGHKPATVAQRYRSLQALFKWLVGEGELTASPMRNMRPPSIPENPPPVLGEQALRSLLATCSGQGFAERRDRAIMLLLMDSGLRRAEIANLRIENLDLDGHVAWVLGKGRRERPAAFGRKAAQALDRYLRVRAGHPDAESGWLWLGKRGRLGDTGIGQLVRRRGRQAGLGENVHPHLFRHSWAHRWLAQGGPEQALMSLAGWRSRQMLDRYGASAASERARQAHREYSPGDSL